MDPLLVVRAQRGDQEAFGSLAEAVDDRFHGVAYGILRDMALAQDAVQVALLAVWRDLPKLREPDRFEAWSYRLLVRACYAEIRHARRRLPNLLASDDVPLTRDDIASVVDRDQLERAFRHLPADHRAILVLHHYLDLPLERVAESLGIPVGTARSRLHRATNGMRAALDADARVPVGRQSPTKIVP